MSARRKLLRGMKATKTPAQRCGCGQILDRASHASAQPEEGDVSICIRCGALRRFNADLTLRPATLAELDAVERQAVSETWAKLGFNARD